MSLYNALFGTNAFAGLILSMLGEKFNPGRFRDAHIDRSEEGDPRIVIYTRNGGGNRECWSDGENCACQACLMAGPIPETLKASGTQSTDMGASWLVHI